MVVEEEKEKQFTCFTLIIITAMNVCILSIFGVFHELCVVLKNSNAQIHAHIKCSFVFILTTWLVHFIKQYSCCFQFSHTLFLSHSVCSSLAASQAIIVFLFFFSLISIINSFWFGFEDTSENFNLKIPR